MNKKAYIIPQTTIINVELQLLQQFSGQGTDGVKTKGDADESDDPNRSRRRNVWDEEEEDW